MSVFNGKCDEISEISIDMFLGPSNIESTAYFLSHCHTDHMKGLDTLEFNKALLNRDNVYLYTSEISRCILKNDINYQHLTAKIKSLPAKGSSILSIPSLTDAETPKDISVTLIPAGHCPGSVMFLFELEEGNVLYTGDFRISVGGILRFPQLHHIDGTPKEINTCYLDATFFDELHPSFPEREESLKKICDLIEEWLDESPEHEVLIDTPAKYGYEHVFVGIKDILGTKVHVSNDIFSKHQNVAEIGTAVTNDSSKTRVHACGFRTSYYNLPCRKPDVKIKIIRVSCAWYTKEYAMKGSILNMCPNYIRVCYACHCSYSELVDFIAYLSPKKIIACAVPVGKTTVEVEKEIEDLMKLENRKRKQSISLTDESDDCEISMALTCHAKKKVMTTPRKKRPFVKVSEGISSDESWSRNSNSEVKNISKSEIQVDAEPSILSSLQTSQSLLIGQDRETHNLVI